MAFPPFFPQVLAVPEPGEQLGALCAILTLLHGAPDFKENEMSFQVKLVDPNGNPKAVVCTHDRVASGKEFALFQHMLGIMALGCVPDEQGIFDAAGHQMTRVLTPDEIVDRAEALVRKAMQVAAYNEWVVEAPDIDHLYHDHDSTDRTTGFVPRASVVNLDDDIPF